jgi:hypothetical protein
VSDDHESGKWLKVKARMPMNQKVIALSDAAFRLYFSVACWCCDEVNDGRLGLHVPSGMPKAPPPKKLPDVIKELVNSGLWKPLPDGAGYEINDFLKYNMSRAQWEAKKAAGKKGGKLSGESRRNRKRFEEEAPPEAPASPPAEAGASGPASAPATAPTEHENENDQRSKNNPPPKDLSGSAPEAPRVVVASEDLKVPCPANLTLTEGQASALEIGQGMNAYQVQVLSGRYCSNFSADPRDLRTLTTWRKCMSQWISGQFTDPKRRPPRSADAEETEQQMRARLKNGTRQTNVLGHLDDAAFARKTGAILE